MAPDATHRDRFTLVARSRDDHAAQFARDVHAGLTRAPKTLSCRYFYDADGSRLFEEICTLPEYYLTRTETQILRERAAEIVAECPAATRVVELGSGSAAKTRILLDAFLGREQSLCYVPVDISQSMLEESSAALLADYPTLEIVAVACEYDDGLSYLVADPGQPKLILWLGSNIGNFDRRDAAAFLRRVRQTMTGSDRLLVGIDLRKDRSVLEPAYDDSRGVTARFNLNLLARINRDLGGHFDIEAFRHRAIYDDAIGRIEMYLVSRRPQRVAVDRIEIEVSFAADEAVHTENSYKYAIEEVHALASAAGLRAARQWLDAERRFSVNLFERVEEQP